MTIAELTAAVIAERTAAVDAARIAYEASEVALDAARATLRANQKQDDDVAAYLAEMREFTPVLTAHRAAYAALKDARARLVTTQKAYGII